MKITVLSSFCLAADALLCLGSAPSVRAQDAVKQTVLHRYVGNDLQNVSGALTLGRDGNLYGTTSTGGTKGGGSAFKIDPDGKLTVLHSFDPPGQNTTNIFSNLVEDRNAPGVFYGTDSDGGDNQSGAVYLVTADGAYALLHSFNNEDGYLTDTALVQGRNGDFYGTSFGGGNGGAGTVYKITPAGGFTLLHSFELPDGFLPDAALVEGSDGNFYGTTGQISDEFTTSGTVFRISPTGDFTNLGGLRVGGDINNTSSPNTALVEGTDGNFYGTTGNGTGQGTVYRVTSTGVVTVLHQFTGGLDGGQPRGLKLGADGNFYGQTSQGGLYGQTNNANNRKGYGTIFQITPAGTLTTLYNFTGNTDGRNPFGELVPDGKGGFYAGNGGGSTIFAGLIYRLTITKHPAFFTGQMSYGNGFYYLQFPIGNYFGYYGFLDDPNFIYHADLGYEYVFDANDGRSGVYLFDYASDGFFYTNPAFPFPYLYDFKLNTVVYYYPDTARAGHFTMGPRYFYNFATRQIIAK